MAAWTKPFSRIQEFLGSRQKSRGAVMRRSRKAIRQAVIETLEPRQLMDSTNLSLYYVQFGEAPSNTYGQTYSMLSDETVDDIYGFVAASSWYDAATKLLNACTSNGGGASVTINSAVGTQSGYTPGTYTQFNTDAGTDSSFTMQYVYANPDDPNFYARFAYAGSLVWSGVQGTEWQVTAFSIPDFCLACNGIYYPGFVSSQPLYIAPDGSGQIPLGDLGGADQSSIEKIEVPNSGGKTIGSMLGLDNGGNSQSISLVDADPDSCSNPNYLATLSGSVVELFARSGSSNTFYSTAPGSQSVITYDGTNYTLTDADGNTLVFGNRQSTFASGFYPLIGSGDPGGNQKTNIYDTSNKLTATYAAQGATVYTYDTYGRVVTATTETTTSFDSAHPTASSWTTVQQTSYEYYGTTSEVTLLTVTENGTTNIVSQNAYVYYDNATWSSSVPGVTGEVEFVFGQDSYARLLAGSLTLSSPNSSISAYADVSYQYDADGRITQEIVQGAGCSVCGGGLGTYTFQYDSPYGLPSVFSTNSSYDYNTWIDVTTQTTPDGTQTTNYTNFDGEPMLVDVLGADGQRSLTYYRYNDSGQQVLEVSTSGFQQNASGNFYDPNLPDLVNFGSTESTFLSPSSGLFQWTEYYTTSDQTARPPTDTSAGAVAGQVEDMSLSQGSAGPRYYQSFTDYYNYTAGGASIINVADSTTFATNFTNSSSGSVPSYLNFEASGNTTHYAYTFYSGTNQLEAMTTTLPTVNGSHNGPGSSDLSTVIYDSFGNTIWTQDGDENTTYTAYNGSGVPTLTLTDPSSSQLSSSLVSALSTLGISYRATGLGLTTTYVVDDQGRTTQETDPNGNITLTVYDDAHQTVFTFPDIIPDNNYTTGSYTFTTTTPIIMERADLPYEYTNVNWPNESPSTQTLFGSYTETLTFSGTITVTAGVISIPTFQTSGNTNLLNLVGNATSGFQFSIQSLSRSLDNAASQMVESDSYFFLGNGTTADATYLSTASLNAYTGSVNTNYYATQYAYDDMGRQARTINSNGTITDVVYDAFGRQIATYVGTNDSPNFDFNGYGDSSSGNWEDFLYYAEQHGLTVPNATYGTNMTLVSLNTYDGGGVGDGNLTQTVQFPGGSQTPRATDYLYDWRDRQVSSKSEALTSTLPSGFTLSNIGSPGVPGTATFDSNSLSMTSIDGSGSFYAWGEGQTSDQFTFVSIATSGDFTFITEVSGEAAWHTDVDDDPFAGIMVRQSNDADSAYNAWTLSRSWGLTGLWRSSSGVASGEDYVNFNAVPIYSGPVWLKLTRTGNDFEYAYSPDGTTWQNFYDNIEYDYSGDVQVGLVVSAETSSGYCAATFNNISINGNTFDESTSETDGLHRPLTVNTLDNAGDVIGTYQFNGDGVSLADTNHDGVPDALDHDADGVPTDPDLNYDGTVDITTPLIAYSAMNYDEQGRAFKTITYDVNSADGTYSTASSSTLVSETWYDARGDTIAAWSSGGPMTKMTYDGAGRVTATYTTDGGALNNTSSSGTILTDWADAGTIGNDVVLSQVEYQYDANGNAILTTDREAFNTNGTTSTGSLLNASDTTGHAARVSYAFTYYDAANRPIESVNAGTNGSVSDDTSSGGVDLNITSGIASRPVTMPNRTVNTDTLITTYSYNAAGEQDTVTDPKGIAAKALYDLLGNTLFSVSAWDGSYDPSTGAFPATATANQTTAYTWDGDGHMTSETAYSPGGASNQTTAYIYNLADATSIASAAGLTFTPVLSSNDTPWMTQSPDLATGEAGTASTNLVLVNYDALGEPLTKRDQNGIAHTYTYDALGRLTGDAVSTVTASLSNGGFEAPVAGSGNYVLNATGGSWMFSGDAGVASYSSSLGTLSGYSGAQVGFLQSTSADTSGSMSQTFSISSGEDVQVSFELAQQTGSQETVEVDIDGHSVGQFTATSSTFTAFTSDPIAIGAGEHTLTMTAVSPKTSSNLAFLDSVLLTQATGSSLATITVNDSSFQNQTVSDFVTDPTGSAWTFTNNAGIAANGGTMYTVDDADSGSTQVAYLESEPVSVDGRMSQTFSFVTGGTYYVKFTASSRDSDQVEEVKVEVDGTVVDDIVPLYGEFDAFISDSFTVPQGDHVLSFLAVTDPAAGDYVALIDNVQVVGQSALGVIVPTLDITTSYNTQGLVDTVTSYDASSGGNVLNQVQNLYNGFGQLTQQYQNPTGAVVTGTGSGHSLSVQYGYDTSNAFTTGSRLTSMTYPSGQVLYYNYGDSGSLNDVISRLDNMVGSDDNGGTVTLESYQYLGLGTLVQRVQNQANMELTYIGSSAGGDGGDIYRGLDRFGRIIDQKWIENASGSTLDEYTYTYDADSNVLTRTNVVADAASNSSFDQTYSYDDLNQLTSAYNGTNNVQSYTLDALGNITGQTNGTSSSVTSTFNAQNQLVTDGSATLAFDANGNTTLDDQGDTLVYNAWNQLIAVNNSAGTLITSYSYDGTGRQVGQSTPGANALTLYYDSSDQLIEQDVPTSYYTLQSQYVWSAGAGYPDALVLRDEAFVGAGFNLKDRTYALQDANWNVTALVTYSTLPGDTNGDGTTNFSDFGLVLQEYGHHVSGGDAVGDFNHDGVVDATDLATVLANYDSSSASTSWTVAERFAYTPDGQFTTYTPTLTVSSDYLGWTIYNQGMREDTQTGLYLDRNRVYSPTMDRFLQTDPMGYVDGIDDYIREADNPIKYMDPSGTDARSRRRGGDLAADDVGTDILIHWLAGSGKELDIDADSEPKWTNYLQADEWLSEEVSNKLLNDPDIRSLRGKPTGTSVPIKITMHAEVENGEGVIGYQYLHGSNATVGDFQISGTAKVTACGRISISGDYKWNDIIDPNPAYTTDKIKAAVAHLVLGPAGGKDYKIRISWHDESEFPTNSSDTKKAKGWPFEQKKYSWGDPSTISVYDYPMMWN